jgi:hypothetical protein
MSTAEYAVGTVAAAAFAGLLFKIVTSPEVRKMLVDIIHRALNLVAWPPPKRRHPQTAASTDESNRYREARRIPLISTGPRTVSKRTQQNAATPRQAPHHRTDPAYAVDPLRHTVLAHINASPALDGDTELLCGAATNAAWSPPRRPWLSPHWWPY